MREVRAFLPRTELDIAERFGILRPRVNARRLMRAGRENTAAWLDARTVTVGASEISILMMDRHPYHSVFSLWHVKARGWGRHPQTSAQERGHLLEPGIARRFADAHPELLVGKANGALWADPDFPWMSCTPDYLTIDEDGVIAPLELKSDEGGDGWTGDDVPDQHWWQVCQQAGVFAAPHGWLARWNTRGYDDYLIPADDARYVRAAGQARLFLDDVAAGREPEPDGHRSTGAVIRDEHPSPIYAGAPVLVPDEIGDELDALKETRKQVEDDIKRWEHQLRALMGDSPVAFDLKGHVFNRTRTPRKQYTVKPTVIDSVRVSAPRKGPEDHD